jgi:hypothetical protein
VKKIMMIKKITTGIASAAIMLSSFAPLASADIIISGNGSRSDNTVVVDTSNRTSINQVNRTDVTNDVDISNNTGGNRASGNTGGDVSIDTGSAVASVEIHNMAGSNVASVDNCGCQNNDSIDISVHGNGSGSDSYVRYDNDNSFRLSQINDTDYDNDVRVYNNTGDNRASDNTGGGYGNYHYDWFTNSDHDCWKNHNWEDRHLFFRNLDSGNDGDVAISSGTTSADVMIHNMGGSNVYGF